MYWPVWNAETNRYRSSMSIAYHAHSAVQPATASI
jgi:hypothetical protein